jgi:hypothetical protein
MEFAAAPHERWAELAKRLHDTEHAGDDTTSVGEPDEGGGQDETASIHDGVLVVSSRTAAPMLEAVEGTFDDVAAAGGVLVVADRAAAAGATATAMGSLVIGFGDHAADPAGSQVGADRARRVGLVGQNTVGPGAPISEASRPTQPAACGRSARAAGCGWWLRPSWPAGGGRPGRATRVRRCR